jgi:hypothetical protein
MRTVDVPPYTPPRLGTDMLQPDLIPLEADPDAVPLGLRLGGRLSTAELPTQVQGNYAGSCPDTTFGPRLGNAPD